MILTNQLAFGNNYSGIPFPKGKFNFFLACIHIVCKILNFAMFVYASCRNDTKEECINERFIHIQNYLKCS